MRCLPETFTKGYGDGLVRALLFGIHQDARQHWCELRSVEIVVQEIAEEFGGEDPMRPDVRGVIDGCVRTCTKLRDDVLPYVEIELPEPADDDVAQVRLLIKRIVDD